MENISKKIKIPPSFPMIYIDNVLAYYNKNKKLIFIKEQGGVLSKNDYEISFIVKDQNNWPLFSFYRNFNFFILRLERIFP